MKRHIAVLWGLLALMLGALVLASTALAGDGGGNGNGNGGTPPGQEKKAESPPAAAQPATPAQPATAPAKAATHAAKAEQHKAKAAEHAAKKAVHESAKTSSPAHVNASSEPTRGKSAEAQHHVIICHRTGSATNPWVVINISNRGWLHGHKANHPEDKLLKDLARPGEKGPDKSACGSAPNVSGAAAPQAQTAQQQANCPTTTTTTTEQVLVGVWHKTGKSQAHNEPGAPSSSYIWITPNTKSAHYDHSKHEDDIPITQTVIKTVTTATGAECASVAPGTTVQSTVTGTSVGTPATQAETATMAISFPPNVQGMPVYVTSAPGGVAGVSATLPAKKPAKTAGALAATSTRGRGTLPFTGLVLLGVVLVGGILVAAGWALRRRAAAARLVP